MLKARDHNDAPPQAIIMRVEQQAFLTITGRRRSTCRDHLM
jgi:hypothetical protein